MPSNNNLIGDICSQFAVSLRKYFWLWVIPTVLIGSTGSVYAVFRSSSWKAWQALHVRNEVSLMSNGGFDDAESRKAAQETIIELAKNRRVIHDALDELGPPSNLFRLQKWPTLDEVRAVQDGVAVSAPDGSELGETDVIYLTVEGPTPEYALKINAEVCKQLILRLKELRNNRSDSIVSELREKRRHTEENLGNATQQLKLMEGMVGADLGELRTLDQTGSGESNLRTTLNSIKDEMRKANTELTTQLELLDILLASSEDSQKLVSTPNRLLGSHPSIQRLKDGLVDAQLRLAQLTGNKSNSHPEVRAAAKSIYEIRRRLRVDLPAATQSVKADIRVTNAHKASLERELDGVQKRLNELATLRAPYSNLVATVQHHTDQLKEVRQALATAESTRDASSMASLITRIGDAETSDSPIGPGRTVTLGASWVGGFCVGIGLVMLISPISFDQETQKTTFRPADGVNPSRDHESVTQPLHGTPEQIAEMRKLLSISSSTLVAKSPEEN